MTLKDRVGIVTGATGGIGAACVAKAIAEGARLTCCARNDPGSLPPGDVMFVRTDVRRYEEIASASRRTLERWGRIDFLIACAGVAHQGSICDSDTGRWREVIMTNLLGAAHAARAVAPAMVAQGGGHIVLVASVAGRSTHVGEPVYLASKWAVIGLGHALRSELAPEGISVTLVEPGLVDTEMTRGSPRAAEWLRRVDPLMPDDVADAVTFALTRPQRVSINEILLRPIAQEV